MALLDRQLYKMQQRDDIEIITLPNFTELFSLAQQIVYQVNLDSGKSTTFVFGVSKEGVISGIPGNERKIKAQLGNFMNIFKPMIDYSRIISEFSIYYL